MFDKLMDLKRFYLSHPDGVSDKDAIKVTGIPRASLSRYRTMLHAYRIQPTLWTVDPTPLDKAFAEAVYQRIPRKTIVDYHHEGWILNLIENDVPDEKRA